MLVEVSAFDLLLLAHTSLDPMAWEELQEREFHPAQYSTFPLPIIQEMLRADPGNSSASGSLCPLVRAADSISIFTCAAPTREQNSNEFLLYRVGQMRCFWQAEYRLLRRNM